VEPIALVIGIAVAAAAGYGNYRYARGTPDVARLADEEFRQLLVTAGPPELCFDGRSAEIVVDVCSYQDEYRTRVISVTRYARNAYGEYFFFVSEGTGRPLFKHIEHRAAKAALGDRYRAPPSPHGPDFR
jgi:hypothetical protein